MVNQDFRHFRRYSRESPLYIIHNERSAEARTTDYSLNGFGIIVKNTFNAKIGDIVALNINSPKLSVKGEIVWIGRHGAGIRLGIRRIGPLTGSIRDFRFADTFIGLQRANKTGLFKAGADNVVKSIYFNFGDIIFSTSNQKEDRLGEMLVRLGKITGEQYNAAAAKMKKTGQRFGKSLIDLGYISPQELWKSVVQQVEEIILNVFMLQDGWFDFNEGPLPSKEVVTLKLSTGNLIYYGVKRINDIKRILGDLPSWDKVICLSPDPINLFQDIKLDEDGKRIISCIDNTASLKSIVSSAGIDKLEAYKTVHALLSVRKVIAEDKESLSDIPDVEKEDIIRVDMDPKIKDMIEDVYYRYNSLGYYGILDIKSSATDREIKQAYFRAARRYHPDIHFRVIGDGSMKDKLTEIFTYVDNAYKTLSDPEKRIEYDKSLTAGRASPKPKHGNADAKFAEGVIMLKSRKYSSAEQSFAQAIYLNGSEAEYHYYYGISLFKQGKLKDGANALDKAVTLDQYNEKYMTELGLAYLQLGLKGRAKSLFQRVLVINPESIKASSGLAKIAN